MVADMLITVLPFFVGLVWSAILSLEYRRSDPARKMLLWFILSNTGLMFIRTLIVAADRESFDLIRCLYIFFLLVVFPVGYIYIRRLTSPVPPRKRELWLLLPAVGASAAGVIAYFIALVDWHPVEIFARVILPIEVVLMAVFGEMAIRDYRHSIENYYSDTSGKKQKPMYRLLSAYIIFSLVKSVALSLGAPLNTDLFLVTVISLSYSILLFAIAYVGSKASFNAGYFAMDIRKDEEMVQDHGTTMRISELMRQKQLYLRPGLKISDVAMELCTNRSYVSEYINRQFGMSFCDYINSLRVEHARSLIAQDPDTDMTAIYIDSGFASEASFYRNFKKFSGMTPNSFRSERQKGA